MRVSAAIAAALPLAANAANLVLSNDDGWAEINIRTFYDALGAAGENVVLSAPAENESGTGSTQAPPTPLDDGPCEYDSCPQGSPATGSDPDDSRLNYVNSYPATSIQYGIQTLSPDFFDGGHPDLAVSGFNVGANTGSTVYVSGTVGAACEAVSLGVPAIAFSGTTGSQIGYTSETPQYATVYADLSTIVTQKLLAAGKPYLPSNTFLNVNFSPVSSDQCTSASDFKFVLSRIHTASFLSPKDVNTCGSTRLPTESTVMNTDGCWVSISVGKASTKGDMYSAQAGVLAALKGFLSCLPN
ncbi:hypothetical protein ANO11243_025210 [Dothideomycetidae sp. 11243]|nr:hypothetical protein ANO11243_025210 [fungal sp. No.11243]